MGNTPSTVLTDPTDPDGKSLQYDVVVDVTSIEELGPPLPAPTEVVANLSAPAAAPSNAGMAGAQAAAAKTGFASSSGAKVLANPPGWPVYLSPAVHKAVTANGTTEASIKQCLHLTGSGKPVVAVMGLYNRGKTFLLNRLAGVNLPSDKRYQTRGLSFLESKNPGCNVVLLDTAGSNAPLQHTSPNQDIDVLMARKRTTETVLQTMAFDLADIIIVVVHELTWQDQEFLQVLHRKLVDSNKHFKTLLVVHNFYDVKDEVTLNALWRRCVIDNHYGDLVLTAPDVKGSEATSFHFREDPGNDAPQILHFMLAREDSGPGKKFNDATYDMIRRRINLDIGQRPSLFDQLLSASTQCVTRVCKSPVKVQCSVTADAGIPGPHQSYRTLEELGAEQIRLINAKGGVMERQVKDIKSWGLRSSTGTAAIPGPLRLYSSEPIILSADRISFDGFRIVLLSNVSSTFQPTYDILTNAYGLQIIIDLPGLGVPDDDNEEVPVAGGSLDIDVDPSTSRAIVTISGSRQLLRLPFPAEGSPAKVVPYAVPNDQTIVRTERKEAMAHNRPSERFSIVFELDARYDQRYEPSFHNGVLFVTFPLLASPKSTPFRKL